MRVKRDTDREITTTALVKRYATSLEGTLTGLGGNLIIIDDPIKLGDALSEVVRKRSVDWYRSTLVTRPDDKKASRIVVVMQRVHQEDLVGYLLENEDFEVLNLPAIASSNMQYQTGPNRTYTRFHDACMTPSLFRGDDGRAATGEGVQYDFCTPRDVPDGVGNHRDRLDRGMHREFIKASGTERIDAGIFPNICPVAAVLAKLKRVGMRGTAALEYKTKLVLGPIEAAHASIVLRPDHEVLEQ